MQLLFSELCFFIRYSSFFLFEPRIALYMLSLNMCLTFILNFKHLATKNSDKNTHSRLKIHKKVNIKTKDFEISANKYGQIMSENALI